MINSKENTARYRRKHEVANSIQNYGGIENIDYVECKLCGKRGLYIDERHLTTRHNITKKEYSKLFPKALLFSKKKGEAQSRPNNNGNLGKHFSEEHRNKIAKTQIGDKNSFYNKTHEAETVERIIRKGRQTLFKNYNVTNPMHILSVREKHSLLMSEKIVQGESVWGSYTKKGHFFSHKNNKTFFYRSSWEEIFMQQLEKDSVVDFYDVESLVIKYMFEGGMHRYIPDFLINGSRIVEIKPKFRLTEPKVIAKAKAGTEYAIKNSMTYEIVSFK